MLRKRFSAALVALVVAFGIPASAFAADMAGTEVVAPNAGITVKGGANGITTDGDHPSPEQNKDLVKDESGKLPDSEGVNGDKPKAGADEGVATDKEEGKTSDAGEPNDAGTVKDEKGTKPVVEEPKAEEPKAEEPKAEAPKVEEPKAEEPKAEEPAVTEPAIEVPNEEAPKAEEPAVIPEVVPPVEEQVVTEPAIEVEEAVTEPAIEVEPATLKIIYHGKYQDLDETLEEVVEGHNVGDVVDLSEYINKMMKAEYIIYVGKIKEITLKSANDVVELDYSIDEDKYKLK